MDTRTPLRSGVVNGIDVDRLFDTVGSIEENPAVARFEFRARNEWLEGGHTRSRVDDFFGVGRTNHHRAAFVFDADEPTVLMGQDASASPVEYALHALAACVTTSFVYHAAARGVRLRRVESTVEGSLDVRGFLGLQDGVRDGFDDVRVSMRIDGDEPREKLEKLLRIAQERSPVVDIFTNGVPVTIELQEG